MPGWGTQFSAVAVCTDQNNGGTTHCVLILLFVLEDVLSVGAETQINAPLGVVINFLVG